ncbi:MAG TPA: hypothetical protein VFH68_17720 [Polyangia bacterium]|nr:hypothetical protein [Polyangia bacterium]
MRVTRILDLIVIVLLGVVLLMPRPDVTVKAALKLPAERRERVAELQARLVAQPDAVEPAIELANIYLDGHRPDWALATVGSILPAHEGDFRLHHLRAIAYADRFESAPAFEAASRALLLCEQGDPEVGHPCSDADRGRLHLLNSTLHSVAGIDMRKNPVLAKERIMESLHPVFVPRNKTGTQVKARPPTPPGTPTPAPPPAK